MMREVRGRIQYKKLALLLAGAASLPNLFDSAKLQYQLVLDFFNADVVHKVDEIVFSAAKIIEKEYGGICVPVPSDNPYEYWDAETMTGKGLLSMKRAFGNLEKVLKRQIK